MEKMRSIAQGCARLMSRESNLTRLSDLNESNVRVELAMKIKDTYESSQSRITLIVI